MEKDDFTSSQEPPLGTSTPAKADSSISSTPTSAASTPSNYSRPSAQVPPYSTTPTGPVLQGHHGNTPHSVINVDEGTSVRQFSSMSIFIAYLMNKSIKRSSKDIYI